MSASVEIQQFLKSLGAARQRAEAAAVRAINRFGQAVLTNARERCPIEFGDLKRSATGLPAENDDGKITKVIGFSESYAAAVHERLDVHHPYGEAKFLENAMREMTPELAQYVRDEIAKDLG